MQVLATITETRLVSARTLLALFAGLIAAPAAWSSACMMACKGEGCVVQPVPTPPPGAGHWTQVSRCDETRVRTGLLELAYLHRGRWYRPQPLKQDDSVETVFKHKKPDDCAVVDSECLQAQAEGKHGSAGAHGIDGRLAEPGGQGKPCTLRLPCGAILPAEQEQIWRLARADLQGSLQLKLARGQAQPPRQGELLLQVVDGRLTLPAAALQPGAVYTYRLLDTGGRQLASGEFSTFSQKMAAWLRQSAEQAIAQGAAPQQQWYDLLVDNRLWWDALQLEAGATP